MEEVREKIGAEVAEQAQLVKDKGYKMDKCCVGGYKWSDELTRVCDYYRALDDNLETLLPSHYETNSEGKFVRSSFVATGLTNK
jgi:uncharacterized LabA/DUF88 family protein